VISAQEAETAVATEAAAAAAQALKPTAAAAHTAVAGESSGTCSAGPAPSAGAAAAAAAPAAAAPAPLAWAANSDWMQPPALVLGRGSGPSSFTSLSSASASQPPGGVPPAVLHLQLLQHMAAQQARGAGRLQLFEGLLDHLGLNFIYGLA
jgi:hypothetical protein